MCRSGVIIVIVIVEVEMEECVVVGVEECVG